MRQRQLARVVEAEVAEATSTATVEAAVEAAVAVTAAEERRWPSGGRAAPRRLGARREHRPLRSGHPLPIPHLFVLDTHPRKFLLRTSSFWTPPHIGP